MEPKVSKTDLLEPKSSWLPVRLLVASMGMLGGVVMFCTRMNLSVAMLAMVNETAVSGPSYLNSSGIDLDHLDGIPLHKRGTFVWSPSTQGLILGAYFYGYSVTQPFTGYVASKFEAVKLVTVCMSMAAILTMLTPTIAQLGVAPLMATRLLLGACHGPYLTCIYVMYIRWTTRTERATALGAMQIGCNLGICLSLPLSAYLCEFGFSGGYPSAFYVPGMFTLVWTLVWHLYVTSAPETHKCVSAAELDYIKSNTDDASAKRGESFPWKAILCSMPVWTSVIIKTVQGFGYMVIQTKLPAYLSDVLEVPIHINGYISSAIFVSVCVSMAISGPLSDCMYKKGMMTLINIRKLFQAISNVVPAICLALIPLAGKNTTIVYVLLIVSMFGFGFTCGGENPVIGEFAPAYAGHIFGIANTVGAATGIVAPLVVGYLLEVTDMQTAWYTTFYLSSALYLFGAIFFAIFATVELQSWAISNSGKDGSQDSKTATTACLHIPGFVSPTS
ncbi:Sialin [Halotydeus destructor]|nr:Sialin [Halotydeus destructor]